ncbi:MAG: O-methyltransferase, partial [Candidatus Saccharimonadales bacterium]
HYAELNTAPEPGYLQELAEETRANVELPNMLSGHLQGRFLSMISKLMAPQLVLEIGTYTGYSALCLAEGLAPNGTLHTIDINTKLAAMVDTYFRKADYHERIHQHLAPATEVIPRIEGTFDLVFIDADKPNYAAYAEHAIRLLRSGGVLALDNMLWHDKVADPAARDADTTVLRDLGKALRDDERLITTLLPVGDGLLVAVKR